MFIKGKFDALTLESIRKSLPAEQLEQAEKEGLFDLIKSTLHPEKVVVHGKHGDYMAIRNKKGPEGKEAHEGPAEKENPLQKLAKRQAARRNARKVIPKKPDQPKPEGKKPDPKPVPQKAQPDAGKPQAKKPTPKPKPEIKKVGPKPKQKTGQLTREEARQLLVEKLESVVGGIIYEELCNGVDPAVCEERMQMWVGLGMMTKDEVHAICSAFVKKQEQPKAEKKPDGKSAGGDTDKDKRRQERFALNGLSLSFQETLRNRFDDAAPDAQAAFDKYAVKVSDCIARTNLKGTAYYSIDQDRVHLNAAKDSVNDVSGRAAGTTLFHELGHLIDRRAHGGKDADGRYTVSNDAAFLDAIRKDVANAEKAMREELKKGGSKARIAEVRMAVSKEILRDGRGATMGVQDIYGGTTVKGLYPGSRVYHSTAYWKAHASFGTDIQVARDSVLGTEAFAHMYAASSNKEQAAAMEKWLPTAFSRFKEILGEIAK